MSNLELVRPHQLCQELSISKPTLWRMDKRGELPKKVRISERAVGWLRSDIEQWLESRKSA